VAALVVAADSKIEELRDLGGTHVAWVDPLSTTGYVVPRLELAARGLDPRTLFRAETFHRSHVGAVKAVAHRTAECAATYARLNAIGRITRGGWTDAGVSPSEVRVLHASAPLPPDLIAVRSDVDVETRRALAAAFLTLSEDSGMRTIAKRLLGVDGFTAHVDASYGGLRKTIEGAASSGLIEAAAHYLSRLPPPSSPPGSSE
jgi:ABC-type phosphate/phosphonate transport system substrate-binding protein